MRILIVSYVYAPDRSPRAYRWTAIAEYWAEQGHSVTVVSGWKHGDPRRELLNDVTVWRVGNALGERLRGFLGQRSHGTAPAPQTNTRPTTRSFLGRMTKRLYDLTWKRLYWPDYACLWFFSAQRQARTLCATQSYDAVISVSHPFTGHMVGLSLKHAYPHLPWLADVGDPFSLLVEIPLNNYRLYRALNRWAEAKVLKHADKIAVTVQACRDAYQTVFPGSADKTTIIPPLFSLPPIPAGQPSPLLDKPGFHLVFLGTLYQSLRNPTPLLALFATLLQNRNDLHLHFLGAINDCDECFAPYAAELGKHIHLHGMVPRDQAALCMANASVLVNIGNATTHQLPSKLVEYVSTGRPILNLVTTDQDTSIPFLAEYPAALSLTLPPSQADLEPDDSGKNHQAPERLLDLITTPPAVDPVWVRAFLDRFTVNKLADQYLSAVAP